MVEIHTGQYSWTPKTVIFEGKEYPAPLDLLPIITKRLLLEVLLERRDGRGSKTN